MKKFSFWTRSLLLLCFIVFCGSNGWAWSDFALIGNFSGSTWTPIYLQTKVNENHFTGTIDASSWENNKTYEFKFYNEENGGATQKYWGTNYWKIDFTSNSTYTIDEGNNGGNMTFKHNSAYSSYTVDAEYKNNSFWHVTITGVSSEQKYTINITNGTGGTVSPSGDQQVGATGINITATPNTGYRFKEWTVSGGASVGNLTSATTTLTATAAGTVTANFEQSSTPTPTPSNTDYAYYLIGNFMSNDDDNINATDRKFRFFKNPDGTYYFDVPATLTVKSQIVAVEGSTSKIYGPESSTVTVFNIKDNGSETYPLGNNTNYFQAYDRGYQSYGMYTYTLTVDPTTGAPLSVKVTHNQLKTVAYFWPEVTATSPNPTVQPCYSSRDNAQSGGDDKYFGSVNLEKNQKCFVIGNMCQESNNDSHGIQYTKTKLYVQGNGGGDVIERKNQPNGVDYTKVYPTWADENRTVNADGFTFGGQAGAYLLEYNPSKGYNNVAAVNEGIGGEVMKGNTSNQNVNITDPITSISVIGEGIPGSSWNIDDKKVMKYNQELHCYEYTFTKTTDESKNELFRFIANDSWNINFEENGIGDSDKARVPYNGTGAGHSAMESDPNYVKKAGEYNGQRADAGSHDIILNRPAGEWTIRFYIVTKPTQAGNDFTSEYYYTITGKENNKVELTYRHNKFIRTYSNNIPMDLTDGVKAYIAYKFEPATGNDKYGNCKVYLRQMKYIPANVGVVLVGQVPVGTNWTDGNKLAFSLQKRIEADPKDLCEVWVKYESYTKDEWHNFLVPTVTAVNNLGNAKVNRDGKIIYRYFGLSSYHNTAYYKSNPTGEEDYIGFFRLTEQGTSGANKAYLSIPSSAVVGTDGVTQDDLKTYGCLDFNAQLSGQETDENGNPSLAKAMLLFDDENFDNDITAIGIITENDSIVKDNAYYNLQGVRVATPSKGIYIFNGKKILVK
ncbi:MAG: hypothetical protein SPD82_10050 [Prevotella sp.]|nr:hypothetical protein [Prevotella sp.]